MTRLILLLPLLAACAAPAPSSPAPAPPPPPAPAAPAPPQRVWTRLPGLMLGGSAVPNLATRLDVLEVAADSIRVRCPVCVGLPTGWVRRDSVTWEPGTPAAARRGDLADFVAAVHAAAETRDYEALRAVMPRTFVHAIDGPDGPLEAIGAWRGPRAGDLARLPIILDQGVVQLPGVQLWAAPREYVVTRGYRDLRAGFARGAAGWEFIFLVRNEL